MENLIISVHAILPMFLVMALGYGARCLGWIHREEISNINKIAFRIFLPCLLFYNVYCSDLSGSFDPLLIAYAVGGVLLSFALALGYTLLTEKLPERRGVMIQGMFRSNYVIMGIPVATALLGADQLGTVSILIAIIVPIFNMMSIIVLEVFRGQKPKPLHILGQIAKNPLVIASVLGVLALVAKIRLPYVLEKTVQSVSGIASPLQLFLLGAFFQFSGLRRYARELTAVVAAKLIVFPGLRAARLPGCGVRVAAGCVRLADRRQLLHHGTADGRRCGACRRHRRRDLGREHADDVSVGLSVQIPRDVLSVRDFTNRVKRRIIFYYATVHHDIKRTTP